MTDLLEQFSGALAERAAAVRGAIAAIRISEARHLSATLWQPEVAVASEQSLPRGEEFKLVVAGDDDLQIMTIHKAKGLEFGTVIVPGLDKAPATGEPPLFLWKEMVAEGSLLLAPIKSAGGERDPIYAYLRALDAEAEDMEASRLLYVAATRAEQRLHLLGCVKCDEEGNPKAPHARSLLARAWPVAEAHPRLAVRPRLPELHSRPITAPVCAEEEGYVTCQSCGESIVDRAIRKEACVGTIRY